jgi:hypothetical protein
MLLSRTVTYTNECLSGLSERLQCLEAAITHISPESIAASTSHRLKELHQQKLNSGDKGKSEGDGDEVKGDVGDKGNVDEISPHDNDCSTACHSTVDYQYLAKEMNRMKTVGNKMRIRLGNNFLHSQNTTAIYLIYQLINQLINQSV